MQFAAGQLCAGPHFPHSSNASRNILMKQPLRFLLFVFVALATVVGCGGAKKTYAKVKGTVTFNGKPLDKGEIYFTLPGKTATFMEVVDGKFSGQALVGPNTVSLSIKKKTGIAPKLPPNAQLQAQAYRAKGVDKGGADPKAMIDSTVVDLVPPEWGASSKQVREVEIGAANEFEFSLTGAK